MNCPHGRGPDRPCPFSGCHVAEVHTAADVDRIFAEDPTSCVAEMAKMLLRNPGKPVYLKRIETGEPASVGVNITVATSPRAKSEPPPPKCFTCPQCGGSALGLGWLCAKCGEATPPVNQGPSVSADDIVLPPLDDCQLDDIEADLAEDEELDNWTAQRLVAEVRASRRRLAALGPTPWSDGHLAGLKEGLERGCKKASDIREHYDQLMSDGKRWEEFMHPVYGPCDGFDDGMCSVCKEMVTTLRDRNVELERADIAGQKRIADLEAALKMAEARATERRRVIKNALLELNDEQEFADKALPVVRAALKGQEP